MAKTKNIKLSIEEIPFYLFFKALKTNDHNVLNVSVLEFEELEFQYSEKYIEPLKGVEKQLEVLSNKILCLDSYIHIINLSKLDEEIQKELSTFGINTENLKVEVVIKNIEKKIDILKNKHSFLKTQLPLKTKSKKNLTAYDLLASLSLSGSISFDFKKITVGEYFSYSKALKEKSEQEREAHKKSKNAGSN